MIPDKNTLREARELMLSKGHAILSTQSLEYPGFPFGSVAPYVCDVRGLPTILVSTIAQHTKNMDTAPEMSLTITADSGSDVQAAARLCLLGRMRKLGKDEDQVKDRYYRFFPQAKAYHEAHDFHFYGFEPEAVRYIGGFGKIFWLEPKDFFLANPFSEDVESGMLHHMNAHHNQSIKAYCQHYAHIQLNEDSSPIMAGMDAEGMHILHEGQTVRIPFKEAISAANEARELLTNMSHEATAALN